MAVVFTPAWASALNPQRNALLVPHVNIIISIHCPFDNIERYLQR